MYVGNYTSSFLLMTCSGGPPGRYGLLMSSAATFGLRPPPGATLTLLSPSNGVAMTVSATSTAIVHHGTFAAASDERLKDDIQDSDTEACQKILAQVNTKTYTRKDHSDGFTRLGFIAQDVQAALPQDGKFQNIITSFTHGKGDDQEEMLGVDYSRMVCVLWNCVKSLTARLEALEAQTKRPSKKSTKVNSDAL